MSTFLKWTIAGLLLALLLFWGYSEIEKIGVESGVEPKQKTEKRF